MSTEKTPIPLQITLYKKSRRLEVEFDNGERFIFPCAFLRSASLSADMRYGEGPSKEIKDFEHVNILAIEPVGNYAIKPIFSDGHSTGIYSWQTLYDLGLKLRPLITL